MDTTTWVRLKQDADAHRDRANWYKENNWYDGMTIADFLPMLNRYEDKEVVAAAVEVLAKILGEAAGYYDCVASNHGSVCCQALELADSLVRTDDVMGDGGEKIDENLAEEIINTMVTIADFVLEEDGLSPDTRERLRQFSKTDIAKLKAA
jgi:hypothetical protein